MKEPFEEIRITDLDADLTQPWVKIFEQERRFPSLVPAEPASQPGSEATRPSVILFTTLFYQS